MKVYLLQNIYSKSAVQLLGTFVNFSTKMFDGYKNSKQLKMQIEKSFPTVPHSCLYVNVATSRVFVSKSSTKGKLHHLKNSSHYLVTIIKSLIHLLVVVVPSPFVYQMWRWWFHLSSPVLRMPYIRLLIINR